ncbi:MAG: hypothetical protein JNK45_01650 [Myxococcales bacterium]|nr:hypothetical protein [Myxococcales bacterium]
MIWFGLALAMSTGCGDEGESPTSTASSPTDGASSDASSEGSATAESDAVPAGTCAEILASTSPASRPSDNFWICLYECGVIPADTIGDDASASAESYDALEPGQPDMCYELRTALYDCFSALTCADVLAYDQALNVGEEGPCTAEYLALEPEIEMCGI